MPKAKRGEIWLVDLGLVQKTRPCLAQFFARYGGSGGGGLRRDQPYLPIR